MHLCSIMHQWTEMDEGSITMRKESQNGSKGRCSESETKDKQPVKATVLQKDVSLQAVMCVFMCWCVGLYFVTVIWA